MDRRTLFLLILSSTQTFLLASHVTAQQNYSGISITSCMNNDTTGPSPAFLYTCNGLHNSCLSFLIFKSKPPHNSTITISNLTSSNPQLLAKINNATLLTVFPNGKEVIIPVNCSCSTKTPSYYEAETKYVLPLHPTYYTVAFNTYQGLSTCDSLVRFNPYGVLDLFPGMELHVPLRCACPTGNQFTNGVHYLLTYPVNQGDNISYIAQRFNVTPAILVHANGFSSEIETHLYPLTTLLIPLTKEPNTSITIVRNDHDQTTISPPLVSVNKKKGKHFVVIIVATTVGSFVLILCLILSAVLFFLRKRSTTRFFNRDYSKGKTMPVSEGIREEIACIDRNQSRVYKFEEIKEATEGFSSRNKIQGSVYRGVFDSTDEILVIKKVGVSTSAGYKEVNLLGKINHFNLIKLKGYCKIDGVFFCLVFEYMENGSLREWLDKTGSTEHQSWANRIQIALDIANGLEYLHNFTEPCYVHKGITTDNILLNRDLRAKIANFSLAQESEREIASKIDVYAFGVVLLELITGKYYKPNIFVEDGRQVLMLSTVMVDLIDDEEKVGSFIDPCLTGNSGQEKVFAMQLVRLSQACLMEEPAMRPDMGGVVSSLLKIYRDMDKSIAPLEQ